jgi:hypothetical protein
MTIKLVLLKSGEDIIADVQEMLVGDEENPRVIGYFLTKPCVVKMRNPGSIGEDPESGTEKRLAYQVSLYPWMPLSKEKKIPITADWVITITDPIYKLKEMYIEDVVNYGKDNQSNSSDEPTVTDN